MKSIFYPVMLVTLLVIVTVSCKKDKGTVPDVVVTAADLVNYYIPIEAVNAEGHANYRVLYFTDDAGTINATYDGPGLRRGQVVTIDHNSFSFDFNSDGTTIFEFSFVKNNTGELLLKNTINKGTSAVQVVHAELIKNSTAAGWNGKTFKRLAGPAAYFMYYRFSQNKTLFANSTDPNTAPSLGCYALGSDIGFKSNNDLLMGIFVPSWKGDNTTKMLLVNRNIDGLAQYQLN